jgi:hypothetical protein
MINGRVVRGYRLNHRLDAIMTTDPVGIIAYGSAHWLRLRPN